jgi:hypothetical protein
MSNQSPQPSRPHYEVGEIITDSVELAALDERDRENRKTAMYQIGCWTVVDVPLPLLAQYIAESPAEDQQEFLKELLGRLPPDALRALNEAMQLQLARGAA